MKRNLMSYKNPVALVILDGFGYRKETDYNAIAHAHTPTLNELFATYPHTFLRHPVLQLGYYQDMLQFRGRASYHWSRTHYYATRNYHTNAIQDGTFSAMHCLTLP
jgi:2,3-bisphosphoglycerate-independent phosphoglycerate mutase